MVIPFFKDEAELRAKYNTIGLSKYINFEGLMYKYVHTRVNGIERARVYRSENEQHTLGLHVVSDVLMRFEAYYSVGVDKYLSRNQVG